MGSLTMAQQLPILRGQIRGTTIPGSHLVDEQYRQDGKYKYYLILQGDESFRKHPLRAVALINSLKPPYLTTNSQFPLRNISEQCYNDPDIMDHGYIDLSYIVMLPKETIVTSDFVMTLLPESVAQIDKKVMIGMGI